MTAPVRQQRRRHQGASERYRNLVAGPDPVTTLAEARRLAGEAEAVVWVHEATAAAWGLPGRLGRNHGQLLEQLVGEPVREIGSTGWARVQGQPGVYFAFPGYSGDFAGAADVDELGQAVELFRHAVGLGFLFSGASTIHKLVRSTTSIDTDPPIAEPDLDPGYVASAWSVPANGWGLADLSVLAAAGRPWVRCFDRSGSYLSAWRGLNLPVGEWHHADGDLELEPGPETHKLPGYYLVDPAALPDLEGGLSPWRRHGDVEGPVWLTTPLAQLATELLDGPLEVREAWVTPRYVRALDVPGERLAAARTALGDDASPAAQLALGALKVAYAGATAWFEYGPRHPEPLARPCWRRTIIDRYAANTWRSLAKASPAPFAFCEIDTAIFALENPGDVPVGLRTGTALGAWKPKGEPIAMTDAIAAHDAGGARAIVQLAEGRA